MNSLNTVVENISEIAGLKPPTSSPENPIPQKELQKPHAFSRELANEHGIPAAIVLAYLANRVEASAKSGRNTEYYNITITQLAEHYRYLTPNIVSHTLAQLKKKGVIQAKALLSRSRKLGYSFADPAVQKTASADLIRFQVTDACEYGVEEALVLANLRYWIKENQKEKPDYCWHRISTPTLAKHLPVPERSLRRALDRLVSLGAVTRRKAPGFDQAFLYCLTEEGKTQRPNSDMHRPDSIVHRPESEMERPNSNVQRPICNVQRPDSNIYNVLVDSIEKTLLESSPLKESVGENTFITPPAAPSGSCVCSNTHAPETKEAQVSKPSNLPISAEGIHSQVGAPTANTVKELSISKRLATKATSERFDLTRKYLKRPLPDEVASKKAGSSNTLVNPKGKGDATPNIVPSPSGRSVSPAPITLPAASGADQPTSKKGVAAPSSKANHVETRLADKAQGIMPFAQPPPPLSEPARQREIEYRRQQKIKEEAERQREKQAQEALDRRYAKFEKACEQYASPFRGLEKNEKLSPEEKVKVLKAGLRSMLKTGAWDEVLGYQYSVNPIFTKGGLELAKRFFELNRKVAARDLIGMINICCDIDYRNQEQVGGWDEYFYQRKGTNLSFLLKHLPTINAKTNQLFLPPDVVYLDEDDSGKGESEKPKTEGVEPCKASSPPIEKGLKSNESHQ